MRIKKGNIHYNNEAIVLLSGIHDGQIDPSVHDVIAYCMHLRKQLVHRENLLAWIRMKFMRISCQFYVWKRDEKQAYEYRTKKTHDIRANFTRFHAIFIRLSCEINFTRFSCVKWYSLIYHKSCDYRMIIAWYYRMRIAWNVL